MKTLSAELREALLSADYVFRNNDDRSHRLLLNGQLAKKVYADFKRILACLGGQWERGKEEHSFVDDPRGDIEEIVKTGKLPALNPFDYFPTPPEIVELIVESSFVDGPLGAIKYLADHGTPRRVLEPETGTGAFASALAEKLGGTDRVVTIELNPINCRHLRAQGFDPIEIDFLQWKTEEKFPLIVMNPPFAGRLWRDHLDHALTMLSPTGRLVCIAPTSALDVRSEADKKWLRTILNRSTVEMNDKGAFAESGTNVDTLIFFVDEIPVRKPTDGWSYADLSMFHILVHNDSARQERYSEFFTGEEGLIARLGERVSSATGETIDPADAQAFIQLCQSINDDLLTDKQCPVGLVIDDVDYLECLNYDLSNYRLQEGIELEKQVDDQVSAKPARAGIRQTAPVGELQLAFL